MERSMRLVSATFVLVLLLAATAVEGKICEVPSTLFKGLCFSSNNCKHTCRKEQFTRGHCSVLTRACVCTKKC
ncbi:defensin-like protein 2 [Pyrus ussuriensis x Pyrus communis]|uniref:Defensin-like protein 2 n=1 Tax=Pyrus ussuriensis x Pyrus communis TaxID=2448454 RepID=A0A5N5FUS9_9ROSA|nr:defensin-like protein 2 [Pyrus ussuriensis x Pyrus communis]